MLSVIRRIVPREEADMLIISIMLDPYFAMRYNTPMKWDAKPGHTELEVRGVLARKLPGMVTLSPSRFGMPPGTLIRDTMLVSLAWDGRNQNAPGMHFDFRFCQPRPIGLGPSQVIESIQNTLVEELAHDGFVADDLLVTASWDTFSSYYTAPPQTS